METTSIVCAHFHVFTGGPGVGKTTVLHELSRQGYACVHEQARALIREQMTQQGPALPWKDNEKFRDMMFERSLADYTRWASDKRVIRFFDRGFLDALGHAKINGLAVTHAMNNAAMHYRYNPRVFLFPPWRAIYCQDTERRQSWEDSLAVYTCIQELYQNYHYTCIEVPPGTVQERAAFIRAQLT